MQASGLALAPVLAGLLVGAGSATVAQSDQVTAPARPPIEVSVACDSNPERVTVKNNQAKSIIVQRVGSTWQKRAGEPYKTKRKLKPGKAAAFTFGTGTGKGKRVSGSFIFDNEAPKEGVLVKTNRGNVKVRCLEGTNAPLPLDEPAASLVDVPAEPEIAADPPDAVGLLATLAVEPEVVDGYERALFEHWIDADGDGCDTRREVLMAESLTPVTIGDDCSIEGGTWYSAPDGDTLTNPASLDINHVVPLKEAWGSGAYAWTPEQRMAFANDLDDGRTLQAVSAGANRQQGERDPASWLPIDRDAACRFVEDWVAIKANWGLSVDDVEREAIELTLGSCRQASDTAMSDGSDA